MSKFKILSLSVFILFIPICFANTIQKDKNLYPFDQSSVQQNIYKLLNTYHIPGAAVALVNVKGIIWAQGFGKTSVSGGRLVTPSTLFSIQSQTKMFTALGVMLAQQQKLLDINSPITRYIPNIKINSVFENDPADKMTLINLLSHSAGFSHEAPLGNNYNSNVTFAAHIQSILNGTWLQFPVGASHSYSNVGIDLAGYILQVVAKQPYQQYMVNNVFESLDMRDSTLNLNQFEKDANHAVGNISGLTTAPLNYSMTASGGMFSNVIDLSHYIMFQLNNGVFAGRRILNENLLKTMLTVPFSQPEQIEGYALGLWQGERLNTLYYSHLGRGFGYAADLEWYPQYHLGVVVLTNKYDTNNVDIKIAHMLVDPFIKHAQAEQFANLKDKILGEYVSAGGNVNIGINPKKGELTLQGIINWGPAGNNIDKISDPLLYVNHLKFYDPHRQEYYTVQFPGSTGVTTLVRQRDGYSWFFNQSKNDHFGPNKKDWIKYIGVYDLSGYGPVSREVVHMKNGYLYFNDLKLREASPGVFSTPTGEMLVFHSNNLIWADVNLTKENA